MYFLIVGKDGTDGQAASRRSAARQAHLETAKKMRREKKLVMACAMLNEKGEMVGSTMMVNFPSMQEMHALWLDHEPYVVNDVWREIEVTPCSIPDFCLE